MGDQFLSSQNLVLWSRYEWIGGGMVGVWWGCGEGCVGSVVGRGEIGISHGKNGGDSCIVR